MQQHLHAILQGSVSLHAPLLRREVLYEEGPSGPVVTGLRLSKAGKEQIVTADAYVAALDVPGAQRLMPQVRSATKKSCSEESESEGVLVAAACGCLRAA